MASALNVHGWMLVAAIFLAVPRTADCQLAFTPVQLQLGAKARSAAITVTNEGAEEQVFQVYAETWTQDAAGDQYAETADLLIFPRRITVPAGGQASVRVATKGPPQENERAYRLYIEEVKKSGTVDAERGAVSFRIRFAVPVFVEASATRDDLEVTRVDYAAGKLSILARNAGTRRQRVRLVSVHGESAGPGSGWSGPADPPFLLAGASRVYQFDLPLSACRSAGKFVASIQADAATATRAFAVASSMCD